NLRLPCRLIVRQGQTNPDKTRFGSWWHDGHGLPDCIEKLGMVAVAVMLGVWQRGAKARSSGEVDTHDLGPVWPDADADRERPLGVKRNGNGRRPDAALLRLALGHEPLMLQRAHEHGYGLCGQPGALADFQTRDRVLLLQQREHKTFVVAANTH